MPSPIKAFLWIFFVITLFGVLVGTLNLMNPMAVYIPNGEVGSGAEGVEGLITSTLSSAVLGFVFGLVVGLIAWMASKGVNKMNNLTNSPARKND